MQHQLVTKKKSWFHSPWIAFVLIVLVVLAAISVVRAFAKERVALKLRNDAQSQLNQLNAKQVDLSQKIQDFSTPRGVEGQIRDQYRVVKPGEQLVVLVNNGNTVSTSAKPSFWTRLARFVGF